MAKFAEVIEALKNGGSAYRELWGSNKNIVKQIPQCIKSDIVPKMTSLPDVAKRKVGKMGSGEIAYHNQVLEIAYWNDINMPAYATYYIPTWEDIFAEDWVIIY